MGPTPPVSQSLSSRERILSLPKTLIASLRGIRVDNLPHNSPPACNSPIGCRGILYSACVQADTTDEVHEHHHVQFNFLILILVIGSAAVRNLAESVLQDVTRKW